MDDLKFDLNRFTEPKTEEDYVVLLDEALAELENVQEQLDALLISTWPLPKSLAALLSNAAKTKPAPSIDSQSPDSEQ